MDEFSYVPYIFRGALGGVIGHLLLVIAAVVYYWTYSGFDGLTGVIVMGGVLGLMGGAVTGLMIGFLIWQITWRIGKEPSAIIRFFIGTVAFLIFYLVTHIYPFREVRLLFSLIFAILGGGLSGLLAHRKGAVPFERRA